MILAVGIVWGLALGLALGGRAQGLATVRLRWETLVVVLFLFQGFARGSLPFTEEAPGVAVASWAISGMLLLWVLLLNRHVGSVTLVSLGLAANLLVVLVNGGMPVRGGPESLSVGMVGGGFYHQASQADLLTVLADVLPMPGGWIISLGDLLLMIGVACVIAQSCARASTDAGSGRCAARL